jgi:cell division septation protein DedD
VRIGPFKDRAEATRTRDLLQKQDGMTGSVGQ